jgi:hypothetical protein
MKNISKKQKIVLALSLIVGLVMVAGLIIVRARQAAPVEDVVAPPPLPEIVNTIPVSDRPYVEMQPLASRNDLQITIHEPKIAADSVEIALEYDRNEGIMDALLRTFQLSQLPVKEKLFLGSRSAGGHVTYHDDVIGGSLRMEFKGSEPYILEIPWRYDDKASQYSQLSTADGRFQVELARPIRSAKVVVMLSPGLPAPLEGEVIAGPYLFRGVGALPQTEVTIRIRLIETPSEVTLYGWTGEIWEKIEAELNGRTLTAETIVYQAYATTTP